MDFNLKIGLKIEKGTFAFVHLASTSSLVPPVVVVRLPRYMKAVGRSKTFPKQLTMSGFAGNRILVSLALDPFILSPTSDSVMLQCLKLLTHVDDLLAQQNHVVGKVF